MELTELPGSAGETDQHAEAEDEGTVFVGIRLPKALLKKLDREAARQTRNRSNMIVHLIRTAIESD